MTSATTLPALPAALPGEVPTITLNPPAADSNTASFASLLTPDAPKASGLKPTVFNAWPTAAVPLATSGIPSASSRISLTTMAGSLPTVAVLPTTIGQSSPTTANSLPMPANSLPDPTEALLATPNSLPDAENPVLDLAKPLRTPGNPLSGAANATIVASKAAETEATAAEDTDAKKKAPGAFEEKNPHSKRQSTGTSPEEMAALQMAATVQLPQPVSQPPKALTPNLGETGDAPDETATPTLLPDASNTGLALPATITPVIAPEMAAAFTPLSPAPVSTTPHSRATTPTSAMIAPEAFTPLAEVKLPALVPTQPFAAIAPTVTTPAVSAPQPDATSPVINQAQPFAPTALTTPDASTPRPDASLPATAPAQPLAPTATAIPTAETASMVPANMPFAAAKSSTPLHQRAAVTNLSKNLQSPANADGSLFPGHSKASENALGTAIAKADDSMNNLPPAITSQPADEVRAGRSSSPVFTAAAPAVATTQDFSSGDQQPSQQSFSHDPDPSLGISPISLPASTATAASVSPTASLLPQSGANAAAVVDELRHGVEKLRESGAGQMALRVNLPGAGNIDIQLTMRGQTVHATMVTGSPEMQDALRQHWSHFASTQPTSALHIGELNVKSSNSDAGFQAQADSQQQQRRQFAPDEAVEPFSYPQSAKTPTSSVTNTTRRATSSGLVSWA